MDGSVLAESTKMNLQVLNCTNEGDIKGFNQSQASYVGAGGIMGRMSNANLVQDCVNLGPVTKLGNHASEGCYGGIIGMTSDENGLVKDCINGKSGKPKHIKKEEVQNLIELCPDLEELVLDYCYMDDYAPLGRLRKLKKLQLSSCGTGSGKAIENIAWVDDLTELRTLNLVHNKIDDTTALEDLQKLTYLNLGDNPLTDEDLEPIGELKNLETLYLYDLKKITDVSPLASLSKLKFLHIGRNSKLKSVKPLTGLKKLENLRVNRTNISDISYFKNFPALKKLDLGKCPILFLDYYKLEDCAKLRKIVLEQGDDDAALAIDDMINNGYPFEILYNWTE